MCASTSVGTDGYGAKVPWGDVVLSAIAAVSWALIGMAATAAAGLRLLDADAAGSLGPMTAAVVALGAGGSVTPSGDASAFGLKGAEAHTAVEITPLGVSLVGALLLAFFFLRSLRGAGVVIAPAELLARAGAVVALFVAMTGALAWVGHDVITIDVGSLGFDDLPGGGGGLEIPGLGDVGGIGGLLPDRVGDLVGAEAAVGFTVDTGPTLLGGLAWSAGVLLIALLASRRTPLPGGWAVLHRVVRPAVSALVTVALTVVAAGLAAASYAAIGDDHPRRVAGAALLGAPNGAWLGAPVGLFVPWDGRATGDLLGLLPAPLDDLLSGGAEEPVSLGRLAELDGRVWLLGVAAVLLMLLAGVLTAVRTPGVPGGGGALGDIGGSAAGGSVVGGGESAGGGGSVGGGGSASGGSVAGGGRSASGGSVAGGGRVASDGGRSAGGWVGGAGRSSDGVGSSAGGAGGSSDRVGSSAGGAGGSSDRVGSSAGGAGGSSDRVGSSAGGAGGSSDRVGSSAGGAGGSSDRVGSSAGGAGGSSDVSGRGPGGVWGSSDEFAVLPRFRRALGS